MKICIIGAGKMGIWLTDALCLQHEVAIFDCEVERLKYVFNTMRLTSYDQIREFEPELVINAVTLKFTIDTFAAVLPYLPKDCILSDIASVKPGCSTFTNRVVAGLFLPTLCLARHSPISKHSLNIMPSLFPSQITWERHSLRIFMARWV